MKIFNLNQNQFSDFINLSNEVFNPLSNFVNKDEFIEILENLKFKKKYFPYPIFFGISKQKYQIYRKKKNLTLCYKSKKIAKIDNIKFYTINKDTFGKKIFGQNFKKHPYYKKFKFENFKFLNFEIKKIYKINLNKNLFISPKKFKKRKIKKPLACFHTRNVPHNCHKWIHEYLIQKFKSLLIQPLIGQYKKGEYKDKIIMSLNKKIINKYINKKKIHIIPFFSYPRYAGPREAALHALVRKNYGCTHIWIGRDHAGYKNFYKKFESQKFCKKNEIRLGIKIIAKKEPYYCKSKKIVVNDCTCKTNCKIKISGSKIRRLILKKKKIPKILMLQYLSKRLNMKSLIN
tara:strand:- start:420 stop:1457 length:1038 start_codon:yes stop_codon:yes gene_type:complete